MFASWRIFAICGEVVGKDPRELKPFSIFGLRAGPEDLCHDLGGPRDNRNGAESGPPFDQAAGYRRGPNCPLQARTFEKVSTPQTPLFGTDCRPEIFLAILQLIIEHSLTEMAIRFSGPTMPPGEEPARC